MINKILILLTLILIVGRLVNSFEDYNEYLASLTTTTQANIYSVLNPWSGLQTGQLDHNEDADGDTDDYNRGPIVGEAKNCRRYLFDPEEVKEKDKVIINKDNKEKGIKRVKRASKRTIGSILRARGKTTPGTEFSSEEVDGNKKAESAEEPRKDEIKDYDEKVDRSEEKKKKGTKKEIDFNSDEKKDGERLDDRILPASPDENKKTTTTESSNIIDAIRERNEKIRKEFEMREEDEKNRIARAEAIKKAEEEEASKKSSYMLDAADKGSGEKVRPVKNNRKQAVRKSYDLTKLKVDSAKPKKESNKYEMSLNSEEPHNNKKVKNINHNNNRRVAHRKIRRSNAEIDASANDNNGESRRVNYRQKARENLQAYRDHNKQAVSDDNKVDPQTRGDNLSQIKNKPEPQPPVVAASNDRKVDPLLTNSQQIDNDSKSKIIQKSEIQRQAAAATSEDGNKDSPLTNIKHIVSVPSRKVNYRQKARENLEAYRYKNKQSDDKKLDPILADPKQTDVTLNKPESSVPAVAASENPLIKNSQQTPSDLASGINNKPDTQEPAVAGNNGRRRRGREILQIPNVAILDNDYSMYTNDQDYGDGRKNEHNTNPPYVPLLKNVSMQVRITTQPSKTTNKPQSNSEGNTSQIELNQLKVPEADKHQTTKMIISTNLSSNDNVDDKNTGIDQEPRKETYTAEFFGKDVSQVPPERSDTTHVLTTEPPKTTPVAAAHRKKRKRVIKESYRSSMKLYGPVIHGDGDQHQGVTKKYKLKSERPDTKKKDHGDNPNALIGPVLSSKFSQNAPIRNNFNIENLYVLGSEFIKLKGKTSKRSSCHRTVHKPVEIAINVQSIKDGIKTVIEPIGKKQENKQVYLNDDDPNSQKTKNPSNPNPSPSPSPSPSLRPSPRPSPDDLKDDNDQNNSKNDNANTTKEGNWAKLVSKLSDSGFLDIAADYVPKKFDPNDYPKSEDESDELDKDSSSGEYECHKKHKNHTKDATGGNGANNTPITKDGTRKHHSHSHHRHNLRVTSPANNQTHHRFVKEHNNRSEVLTNLVIQYGNFLKSFPQNQENKAPEKENTNQPSSNEKYEAVKMKSYIKELMLAFEKHHYGLVQYDWLGTAVDTESSLLKLLGLTMEVTAKKEIHRSDMTLLNYVRLLFESAVREFPDYIIENTLQAYMPNKDIEEAADIPQKHTSDKKPRAQSDEVFETPNSKYLFREYYIPEPYRRDDKSMFLNYFGIKNENKDKNLVDKTIIDTRFKEFLTETQSNLAELHILFAVTPNEPIPDDWVTMIRTLFISMNYHQRLKYAQILLHIFAADLFTNIENFLNFSDTSLHDILRDNAKQVKDNVNDMILLLKILTYIRLI